jgi:hypothetical protein
LYSTSITSPCIKYFFSIGIQTPIHPVNAALKFSATTGVGIIFNFRAADLR